MRSTKRLHARRRRARWQIGERVRAHEALGGAGVALPAGVGREPGGDGASRRGGRSMRRLHVGARADNRKRARAWPRVAVVSPPGRPPRVKARAPGNLFRDRVSQGWRRFGWPLDMLLACRSLHAPSVARCSKRRGHGLSPLRDGAEALDKLRPPSTRTRKTAACPRSPRARPCRGPPSGEARVCCSPSRSWGSRCSSCRRIHLRLPYEQDLSAFDLSRHQQLGLALGRGRRVDRAHPHRAQPAHHRADARRPHRGGFSCGYPSDKCGCCSRSRRTGRSSRCSSRSACRSTRPSPSRSSASWAALRFGGARDDIEVLKGSSRGQTLH